MSIIDIFFFLSAAIVVASATVVVLSRNIMYSAFSLLFTFFGVAMLYALLSADFLAIAQIMVYIGGILVLIIFGVMLTQKITGVEEKSGMMGKGQVILGALTSALFAGLMSLMFWNTKWSSFPSKTFENSTKDIGTNLLTIYLLPFEVASVLLLLAMIGAALIARRKREAK